MCILETALEISRQYLRYYPIGSIVTEVPIFLYWLLLENIRLRLKFGLVS